MTSPVVPPPAAPQPTPGPQSGGGLAVAALVIGIVAFFIGLVPFLGLVAGLLAILLGVVALRRSARRGLGVAAIVLGGIAALTGLATTTALIAGLAGGGGAPTTEAGADAVVPASQATAAAAVAPADEPTVAAEEEDEDEDVAAAKPKPTKAGADYGGYPKAQARFVKIVEAAADDYSETTNELKGARVLAERDADACKAFGGGKVTSWVGTIHDVGATGDGDGWVEIEIAPTIVVETWNNSLSDVFDETLISPSARYYDRLSELEEGDQITFSGTFVKSDDTCLDTTNLTKTFNAADPNFLFRFSNIRAQ